MSERTLSEGCHSAFISARQSSSSQPKKAGDHDARLGGVGSIGSLASALIVAPSVRAEDAEEDTIILRNLSEPEPSGDFFGIPSDDRFRISCKTARDEYAKTAVTRTARTTAAASEVISSSARSATTRRKWPARELARDHPCTCRLTRTAGNALRDFWASNRSWASVRPRTNRLQRGAAAGRWSAPSVINVR